MRVIFILIQIFFSVGALAAIAPNPPAIKAPSLKSQLEKKAQLSPKTSENSLIFDLPVTYNRRVSYWIQNFQTKGKTWFRGWLEKSIRYMPFIQKDLQQAGLPQDLAYMVMIESGFEASALSHAQAVGPWQFIQPTGERYGLKVNYWLDERKDFKKSTQAAIRYLKDLHEEFGSWYLVAASYNMGEGGLRKLVNRYKTNDFWELSQMGVLPQETIDYVPKILAAMLIAKAPSLYGFRSLPHLDPYSYDLISAPGGIELNEVADYIGVTHKSLKDLNTELVNGSIPPNVTSHFIRIPTGSSRMVLQFLNSKNKYKLSQNSATE